MMETNETRELISALADGQLRGEGFALGVDAAAADAKSLEAWHTYHLIGEVLRTGACAPATAPVDFLGRLQSRLRDEPRMSPPPPLPAAVSPTAPREAANDSSFVWKLVAGFASVAAVAAIGWTVMSVNIVKPESAQLAVVPPGAVLAGSERGVMIRDPRLDELLAAHRELGGASALQAPAGFLRNATFDAPGR